MHSNSLKIMKRFIDKHLENKPLKVLDLGSQVIKGQGYLGCYKDFITNPQWEYIGADITGGDNVDVVISHYSFPFETNTIDVVISGQTMEHVEYPWLWMVELARVLKPNGICCLIAPAKIHEHRYPLDTFRYYPDGMKALAKWANLEVIEAKREVVDKGMEDTYLIARKKQ